MNTNADIVFRIGLLLLFAVSVGIQAYFDRKNRGPTPSAYRLDRSSFHREGRVVFMAHLVVYTLAMMLIAAYAVHPAWVHPLMIPIAAGWRWAALVLGGLTLPGLFEVHRALGKNWSPYLRVREDHELVTTGLYGRVRHPMYSVLVIHTAALGVLSADGLLMGLCAVRIGLLYYRIGREETMLLERFGDQYRAYMKRTGRLLPRLSTRS